MIYSCKEHIEAALDDFITEKQEAPEFEVLENTYCATVERVICSYCDKPAVYVLRKTEVHGGN